jgi:hypothetical protein
LVDFKRKIKIIDDENLANHRKSEPTTTYAIAVLRFICAGMVRAKLDRARASLLSSRGHGFCKVSSLEIVAVVTGPGMQAPKEENIMAGTMKQKAEAAGHKIAEKATEVGHKVGEKVEEAADWAKEKAHQAGNRVEEAAQKAQHKMNETFGTSSGRDQTVSTASICEHMDVIGACGNKLGRVDHVEGGHIKLTKNDSPDGMHHLIPVTWVESVDDQVHLNKSCGEAAREWQTV